MESLAAHHSGSSRLGRKALILVSALALITSGVFLYLVNELPRQQTAASRWIDHTLEVLSVATTLDTDIAMVVGEARGFIIDKEADNSARFEAATYQVTDDIRTLRFLTSDNPGQQSALDRIEPMMVARTTLLRQIIQALDAGEPLGDPSIVSMRQASQVLAEEISPLINDFKAEERFLLIERRAAVRHIVKLWFGVLLGCGIVAAACAILAVALLVGRTRKGEHVAELRHLNAGLEQRVTTRNAALAASETGFRHLAEDLQVSEARYRLLADSTNDLIICEQLDLQRTYASPAARTVLGYEPEEMVSDKTSGAAHPDDLEAVLETVHALTVGEAERTLITYRARHKAGHWIWVEATISLVRDRGTGDPASLVCSLRDISERHAHADELRSTNANLEHLARHLVKARDTAELASRAKSRFLAGMSHELRTPLNGILGYARLLRMEGGLNAAQSTRVDAMIDAGKHLLEMIHCILDLSEIEVERFALQPADFDLLRLAGACLDLVRPTADAKALSLGLSIAPDVPPHIRTDPTRLRQILLNLLGNAVKFTTRGAVDLRVLATADRKHLRFEVTDTGPGILPEQRARLFQEFERLDTDATRTGEGAGLGLSISAQLVTLMGGRIGHQDNPAGGSMFWLELPLVIGIAAEPSPTPAAPVDAVVAERSAARTQVILNILVVDDVAMNRDIASSFLRVAGHKVICVDGGAGAIAAVAATDFDVVLMDIRMPEMDGLEATRRIRALKSARGQVPIVALTAQAFADQVDECRKAGMDSHLAKPFDPETLLAAVVHAIAIGRPPIPAAAGNAISTSPPEIPDKSPNLPVLPNLPVFDAPIFDETAFERTARFLATEAVTSYLQDITDRGQALLGGLRRQDALSDAGAGLAESAHALAGSAGMFGFARLASVGRHFERAVQIVASDAPALAAVLILTLEATLQVIRDHIPAAVAV